MIEVIISLIIIAFIMEFIDAFAGMGFGIVAPILVLLGYNPLDIVFAILFCSAALSLTAGILHHGFKNVSFKFKSKSFKIASVLTAFGIIGILIGAIVAINLPEIVLKAYVGLIFLFIGTIILFNVKKKKRYKFSWKKLLGLGSFASFNKGIVGGGFGPILTGGQIISGLKSKKAVGITSIVEGVVSTFGILFYLLLTKDAYVDWGMILSLLIGGIIATPFAAYAVKRIKAHNLIKYVGAISIILGMAVIIKLILF